jgi:hypothetical protein
MKSLTRVFLPLATAVIFSGSFIAPASAVENGTLALGDIKVVAPQLSGDRRPYCSAALLSEYIVATAAHCFTQNTGGEDSPLRADPFTVSMPGVDVTSDDLTTRVKVMKIVVVPGYDNIWKPELNDTRTQKDDIAFLFLEKPLIANYQIDVATQYEANLLKENRSPITHYGYGLQAKDKQDGKPYKITLNATTRSGNPTVDYDKMFSTEEIGGALCGGDSGGPSYAVINGVTKLVGDTVGANGCRDGLNGRSIDMHTLTAPYLPLAKAEWEKYALENKITYAPIRAFDAIALQAAQVKAAAELKAKQEADAKAAAELKAKQEADAKAAADKAALLKAQSDLIAANAKAAADREALVKSQADLAAANASLAAAQKTNRDLGAQLTAIEGQFLVMSDSISAIQNQVLALNTKLTTTLKSLSTANAKIKKICSAKPKPKGC